MDLKECEYILKIASTRNISKAAEELWVSQPSLSRYLTRVEENLGVTLFDRSTYPISVTPAGEIYLENAKAMLSMKEDMLSSFNRIKHTKQGKISIAASNFRAFCIFPRMAAGFSKLYPWITIQLFEAEHVNYENMVRNGDVDFAIYTGHPADSKIFDSYYLCSDEVYVVLPPNHPYNIEHKDQNNTANPLTINLSLLKDDDFILLSKNQGLYQRALNFCRHFGFIPHIKMLTPLLLTSYSLCMAGLGCTFLYSSFFDAMQTSNFGYAYRIDPLFPKYDVYLIRNKERPINESIKLFIEYIKSHGMESGKLIF